MLSGGADGSGGWALDRPSTPMSRRLLHSCCQAHLVPTSGWPLRACRRCSASGERAETGAGVLRRCYTLFGLRSALACAASAAWQRGEQGLATDGCPAVLAVCNWVPMARRQACEARQRNKCAPMQHAHAEVFAPCRQPWAISRHCDHRARSSASLSGRLTSRCSNPGTQTRPAASACPCSLPGQPHEL